jgi:LAO/AO transport system kinase
VKVAAMVDLFLVLVAPGAGDELQGLKRGIMELADLVVVNKADGELAHAAGVTASDYASALHLMRPRIAGWTPRVLQCSALLGEGIDAVWHAVAEFRAAVGSTLAVRRAEQSREWMWSEVTEALLDALRSDERVAALAGKLENAVAAGQTTPTAAAVAIVEALKSLG